MVVASAGQRVPVVVAEHVSHAIVGRAGRTEILSDVSLAVERGEFVAIVGPSGCGKTMFVNMVGGLEAPTSGRILVNGEAPRPGVRGVGYMFARDALLPWLSAGRNVELALRFAGVRKAERRALAEEALAQVGLAESYDRYRAELSQGMRQRVALARTIVTRPSLLLMDEPFAALDAQTRLGMHELLSSLVRRSATTVVFITHDLDEAITLADRVMVFTRRPAHCKKEVRVELPREGDLAAVKETPAFAAIHRSVWDALRDEVLGEGNDEGVGR
jgi:NitT/TauT family transport system ATP-binding protein